MWWLHYQCRFWSYLFIHFLINLTKIPKDSSNSYSHFGAKKSIITTKKMIDLNVFLKNEYRNLFALNLKLFRRNWNISFCELHWWKVLPLYTYNKLRINWLKMMKLKLFFKERELYWSSQRKRSVKKVFLKIYQNLQESTSVEASF